MSGEPLRLRVDLGGVTLVDDLSVVEDIKPVCEVELELKDGPLAPVGALIDDLQQRYPLAPDSRTKFARGLALARLAADKP